MVRSIHPPIDQNADPVTGSREADNALIARYIAPRPHDSGRANAYLPEFGFRVATLIAYMLSVGNDAEETASFYQLPEDAMNAARVLLDVDEWNPTFVHRG